MPYIRYQQINFSDWKLAMIEQANKIISDYSSQGYSLTLRQVYYQFVSRDWLPERWADAATGSTNNERSYKNLGELISSGRMAGLIDWYSIEDRTRGLSRNSHWDDPSDIINSAARGYAIDKWLSQPLRIEVWVEKDALEGVIARPCQNLDISYFSCRGYTSQTAMWDAARRLQGYVRGGQRTLILHLGDHDPSGIDMSRDIEDRLRMFMQSQADELEVRRIALNMDQIRQYAPPPNPAKITDSRAKSYIEEYGDESWELDALEPRVIDDLITRAVESERDANLWAEATSTEIGHKKLLDLAVERWDDVADFLREEL